MAYEVNEKFEAEEESLRSSIMEFTQDARPYNTQDLPDSVTNMSFAVGREIGGYKEVPLMEDVDLVKRLRYRFGAPVIVPGAVLTSSRRWDRLGFVRTTLMNQAIMAAWAVGTPPETLASWYYGARRLSENRAQK